MILIHPLILRILLFLHNSRAVISANAELVRIFYRKSPSGEDILNDRKKRFLCIEEILRYIGAGMTGRNMRYRNTGIGPALLNSVFCIVL